MKAFELWIGGALLAGFLCWVAWKILRKSDDPVKIAFKVGASLLFIPFFFWAMKAGPYAPLLLAPVAVVLGIWWAPHWGAWLAKPITNLYEGDDTPPTPKPFYSIAEAYRKRGKFEESLQEVDAQLERFPGDYEGMMFKARLNAEDLKRLDVAMPIIHEVAGGTIYTEGQRFDALAQLSDWQMSIARDREAAKAALERIIQIFPESTYSELAAQRIAHLASPEMMAEKALAAPIRLKSYEKDVGLRKMWTPEPGKSQEDTATEIQEHLAAHPLDTEAREQLAKLYADELAQPDEASQQLERLIAMENQPLKRRAHWLNLLADIDMKRGDLAAARVSLTRILVLSPDHPVADAARMRMDYLKLEGRKNEKSQDIRLGSYKKDLGLEKPGGTGLPGSG
jgi:tetratricopeptide (TPR) repeat protein